MREVEDEVILRASMVVVDSRQACAVEAGELISAGIKPEQMVELGELLSRPVKAFGESDLIVYKSVSRPIY
jgi:ornithine cyclodeaminase/alanine dehydrogenase-like protein (mu-crystallin family)